MVEHRVCLYGRPGCHLCDDVREILDACGVAYDEVDITRDPALQAEYRLVIPVVEHQGRVLFEAGMDPRLLPELLRARKPRWPEKRG